MENLLTSVRTTYKTPEITLKDTLVVAENPARQVLKPSSTPSTPQEALDILRSEPDHKSLITTLRYLIHDAPSSSGFHVTHPGPLAAQIVNTLVSITIPNYWAVLKETREKSSETASNNSSERKLLLTCLRSISGLNAIVARVKFFVQATKEAGKKESRSSKVEALEDYLDVLEDLIRGEKLISHLWRDLPPETQPKQKALWHEIASVVSGGKLLSSAAEAVSLINEESNQIKEAIWIADGLLYSRWLAQNIIHWCPDIQKIPKGAWNPFRQLFTKSLRLGYPDIVLKEFLALVNGGGEERKLFKEIIGYLPDYEQKLVLEAALRTLSRYHFSTSLMDGSLQWWTVDAEVVSGAAGYLEFIVSRDSTRTAHLISWLTDLSGAGIGETVGIRRAAIAVLSDSKIDMNTVLEKSLQQFGDPLYINHAPSLQQEVHTQIILLSAGYVHRNTPTKLSIILRSSLYLNAVSNRLAASSTRARFLGMIVGEALSSLVEKPDKQMKFKVEELESSEAQWYKSLTGVHDTIGPIMVTEKKELPKASKKKTKTGAHKAHPVTAAPTNSHGTTRIISIEEIDDDESEEEGLIPYAKPDSDAEDSDEDPTLVQRNRPTAPVYIRSLIDYLRETENYDKQKLGLATAASLIRRKANFGTEVSDHVVELATLLVGLQDKFEIEDFQDMRIQGMVAVLLSQPSKMGQWFSNTFFGGDYSIAQRASILTVLSISARELGGFKEEDKSLTKMKALPENSFPSKRLPDKLHKIYASEQELFSPVDSLSQKLSKTMIQPLAASLADKATGPDILKVRTFSSRLVVESKRKAPTTNTLSAIVANSFFFPLTGRFFAHLKAYGSGNVIFEPYLLSSFLKTLSLILHASGPLTLQLPQMTSEMWDLLLSLRMQGHRDGAVREALLFAFMTLLEVNEDKRSLAETHGRELLETQGWVELLFQKLGTGTEEDDKVRALAAGVLFKIREVVEKYQALLVGDMSSF